MTTPPIVIAGAGVAGQGREVQAWSPTFGDHYFKRPVALPLERELHMEVRGRDLIAGLPRTIPLTSSEVMEALEQPLQAIVAAVRQVLEETPPELSSDIIDKGMVMSGGGSLLRNIDRLLTQVTGVPCHVAENALNCVALGTGLAMEHFDFFRKSLVQRV